MGVHAGLTDTGYVAGPNGYIDTTVEQQQAFHFRWVVSSIEDVHGNEVSFAWECGTVPTCYIDTIEYGPTVITFHFADRTDWIPRATGGQISWIEDRLEVIEISDAGSTARASRACGLLSRSF